MKKVVQKMYLPLVLVLFFSGVTKSQDVIVYDSFAQLESRIANRGDTTLLINFWATWCKPCVQELPYFQSLEEKYKSRSIKILLVSIDFKTQLEEALMPFIKNKNIKPEVVLLADTDENNWIPKVNNKWDGAIPVTWLISGDKKSFHGKAFESQSELEQWVESALIHH